MFANVLLNVYVIMSFKKPRPLRAVVPFSTHRNYSTSKPLNVSHEKSNILSYATFVANEPYDPPFTCITNTIV